MHFDKPTYTVRKTRKKDIPKGLYTKDPISGAILFAKEIEDNQMVVPRSGHHFPIGARARLARLIDERTFVEGYFQAYVSPVISPLVIDPRQFFDQCEFDGLPEGETPTDLPTDSDASRNFVRGVKSGPAYVFTVAN